MNSVPTGKLAWMSSSSLGRAERLDAQTYVFAPQERGRWVSLGELAKRVVEGWREFSTRSSVPTYHSSNIRKMVIVPGDEHDRPRTEHPEAIGPGDVLVTKSLPIRAAWATGATPRCPADGNCVRMVGMEPAVGFWVAATLNHPRLRDAWVRQATGSRFLPRLGVRQVKNMRIPVPPTETADLAEMWSLLEERHARAATELRTLRREVREVVGHLSPALPDEHVCGFQPAAYFDGVWLPKRVILRVWQSQLSPTLWVPLGSLAAKDRRRLRRGKAIHHGRLLKLSDTEGDLTFDLPPDESFGVPTFRIYAEPLRTDEVLLSLLGSSPKAVFNYPASNERIYVSDHWARFRPQVHPGSLALSLRTDEVRWQLNFLSTGAAQQFVTHNDVAAVMVPRFDDSTARRLHRRVCAALEQITKTRAEQRIIIDRVNRLIDQRIGGRR